MPTLNDLNSANYSESVVINETNLILSAVVVLQPSLDIYKLNSITYLFISVTYFYMPITSTGTEI